MPRKTMIPFGVKTNWKESGGAKHIKQIAGKRILNIEGIATAVGNIDEAIRALRKSRLAAAGRSR